MVFVFMLALGVVIISRVQGYSVDLNSFLFGDVLGVSDREAGQLHPAGHRALVRASSPSLYRPLLLLSFDRQRAAALGLPVDRLHLTLLVLVSLAVVIGFRVVGSLLVLGLLIAPPADSRAADPAPAGDDGDLGRDRGRQRAAGPAALLASRPRRGSVDRPGGGERIRGGGAGAPDRLLEGRVAGRGVRRR